ncbi:c-type cytochrome [Oceanicella sp. SM1341]|uniref:cytochrome c oxidase subunit II n=1 Tax=Oceanicella sp. SM1341 TaxID=1548889 RepID=UPI000E4F8D50|nr:c-type cytochrome [Oceanicella sp. SM1341]
MTALACAALPWLAGCAGRQSALAPAGEDAAALHTLFIVMLAGAVVLFVLMNGLFFYLTRINPVALPLRHARLLMAVGGILFPTIVVGTLLVWGLSLLPDQRRPGDGLRLHVTGEQWWWRVEYQPADGGPPVVSPNEIRLPAGQRAELALTSSHVIHSLWIPALGGKMDMFPGRETVMSLRPTEPGSYRGQCAEFCGASHAWMAFEAVVMEPAAFEAWLAAEARDARAPATPEARRGADIFAREGCGACHAVRGTDAQGSLGPDLTHVGSRQSLGAGRLGTGLEDFATWIAHVDALKPEVEMPAYDHLSEPERRALAAYLKGLE